MIEVNINHKEPIIISSNGKYKQRLHLWQDEQGTINFRIIPNEESEKGDKQ